jgi:hypothetical protein
MSNKAGISGSFIVVPRFELHPVANLISGHEHCQAFTLRHLTVPVSRSVRTRFGIRDHVDASDPPIRSIVAKSDSAQEFRALPCKFCFGQKSRVTELRKAVASTIHLLYWRHC